MKIVIFSRNGTVTKEERAHILSKLPAGVEYNITEQMEGDLESAAVFIKEARCDLVVCAKDMMLYTTFDNNSGALNKRTSLGMPQAHRSAWIL